MKAEINESKFGKREYKKGRRVDKCWVFGGVEGDLQSVGSFEN